MHNSPYPYIAYYTTKIRFLSSKIYAFYFRKCKNTFSQKQAFAAIFFTICSVFRCFLCSKPIKLQQHNNFKLFVNKEWLFGSVVRFVKKEGVGMYNLTLEGFGAKIGGGI